MLIYLINVLTYPFHFKYAFKTQFYFRAKLNFDFWIVHSIDLKFLVHFLTTNYQFLISLLIHIVVRKVKLYCVILNEVFSHGLLGLNV